MSRAELDELDERLRRLEQQTRTASAERSFGDGLRTLERRGRRAAPRREDRVWPQPDPGYTCTADGALAQLGERRLCKPEVAGSIPARSIAKGLLTRGFVASGDASEAVCGDPEPPSW